MTFARTALLALLAVAMAAAGPARAQVARVGGAGQGECAMCHLTWLEDLRPVQAEPGAVILMERPAKAVVAADETCLGCHDGSVADSRRRVWQEHGHKRGTAIPAGMKVPDILPLEDGKVACRTCHTAHSGREGEAMADVVFMRVPNDRGQLCQMCHTQMAGGPQQGSHPIGRMEQPVPGLLTAAGGHAGPDGQTMTCQTCHEPHGGGDDHLLIVDANTSELCVTCHPKYAVTNWRPGVSGEHPQNPPLQTDAQRQAIERMGTRVGQAGTLICLSCHKMHQGKSERAMLAQSLDNSEFCISCHPDRKEVFGTAHDLRTNAPRAQNAQGRTVSQSGPCGSCHSFHSYARKPDPKPFDPTGLCTTCHQAGAVAANASPAFSHPTAIADAPLPPDAALPLYSDVTHGGDPTIACLSCHNPHSPDNANFLRHKPDDLCARCHQDQSKSIAGAHAFADVPKMKNGRDKTAAETGTCGFCHAVHRADGPMLWAATAEAPRTPDDLCVHCHRKEGPAAAKPASQFRHPTGPERTAGFATVLPVKLPFYDEQAHRAKDGFMSCGSCHDVHGDSRKSAGLLRAGPKVSDLCVQCHTEQGFLVRGKHDVTAGGDAWPRAVAASGDLCLSCHQVHSNDPKRGLWTFETAGQGGVDNVCVTCHAKQAWAGERIEAGQAIHPRPLGQTDAKALAGVPVERAADGQAEMVCRTCHNPHAPRGTTAMLRTGGSLQTTTLCFRCHEQAKSVEATRHGHKTPAGGEQASGTCAPCHAVHATATSSREMLWAVPIRQVDVKMELTDVEKRCLTCHGPGGTATQPTLIKHPKVSLPKGSGAGGITCETCHMPHGRADLAAAPGSAVGPDAEVRRDALRPMLRPDSVKDSCAVCHGPDALRRYLYYHQPDKRNRTHFWVSPKPKSQTGVR